MDIFHDMAKYYVQFLGKLYNLVNEVKESEAILKSLLSPKGSIVVITFVVAIVFALFAIKLKGTALGVILIIVVYSLLKHFRDYAGPYAIPMDNLFRNRLPTDIVDIFGDPSHHAIGFICISIVIVILLMLVKNMAHIALTLVAIFLGYKAYVRYLKEIIGSRNPILEIIGVAVAVLILIYLFYWIFDVILVLFFALLGNSILLVYTSAIFNKPENYIDFLTELSQIQSASELKRHPGIVFLIFPALLFFMIQKGIFVN